MIKNINKIAFKLSFYFAVALIIFSIIIGTVFMVLFKNYTIKNHKIELTNRANSISKTVSTFMDKKGAMTGYGAYIKFIYDIAGTDVWIIDEESKLITSGMGHLAKPEYTYTELPQNADELILEVFQNKTVYGEDFSGVLREPTLTVGTPITNTDGKIIGAVLLHSAIYGVSNSIAEGVKVLVISIFVAISIVFLLAIKFSIAFTKPLSKMKNIAIQLSKGDFSTKTNIKQNDEIGELATTIDILSDRLKKSTEESLRLDQMRKDFVANISHELRTPVTVIRGSLEVLIEKIITEPKEIEKYNSQMLCETIFLQRLIGDLLDLSRLQNVDFVIEKENILIIDVVTDVIRSAKPIADKKGITLNFDKSNIDFIIKGDYERLRQMFMIIMDNAIKFSKDESEIDITLNNNKIEIKDYGIGISPYDLENVFTRFYKSRSEKNKTGTGLGLSIAKEIASRHNIDLIATSEYEKGTEFTFILHDD